MTPAEVKKFFDTLDALYPNRLSHVGTDAAKTLKALWVEVLTPIEYGVAAQALKDHAAHSEWSPNPYRLRKLAEDILCPPIHDSPEVAWGQAAQILYENQYGIPSTVKAGPLVYAAMRKVGLKSETAADRQAFMKTYQELVEEDDEQRRRAASGRSN